MIIIMMGLFTILVVDFDLAFDFSLLHLRLSLPHTGVCDFLCLFSMVELFFRDVDSLGFLFQSR